MSGSLEQKVWQVFVVVGSVCGEGEGWGSGGLGRWDSGDVLGGVWGDLRACGVGNFERRWCWVLLKILGGWGDFWDGNGCGMEGV